MKRQEEKKREKKEIRRDITDTKRHKETKKDTKRHEET